MRIKKFKPCPWCQNNLMIKYIFVYNIIEVCCVACKVTRQIEYPKTIIDPKTKQERETTEIERINYAIDEWNKCEEKHNKIFGEGLEQGYSMGVEDTINGEEYKFLRGE